MALKRSAYRKRGANYTEYATLIRCVQQGGVADSSHLNHCGIRSWVAARCRCVRPDQSSATVRCHYLTDGTVNFAFTVQACAVNLMHVQ